MHFRDQMIQVLEKERLQDPAQALQDLGSLVKDKVENYMNILPIVQPFLSLPVGKYRE